MLLHMISCDIYFEQLTRSKMDTSLFKSDFDLQVKIIKEFHTRLNCWKDNYTWKDKLERTSQLLDFPTTCKPTNYNSIVGESILVSFTMIIWLTFFKPRSIIHFTIDQVLVVAVKIFS